ncbi:hypothetical protein QBC38DRAFT_515643 [Podospora fimiseda]|uniref:Uncharacterized protein n=1 Tax=Podospora fimiseda TaxID=252190 RepID=A0AAN7BIJ0_9PEZI|nr:hypothetical protein QBC38DRAFT_515643 [Podospora fimiseda]
MASTTNSETTGSIIAEPETTPEEANGTLFDASPATEAAAGMFCELTALNNSATTRLADDRTDSHRLCQLLHLDIFRAVSESHTRLQRDIPATISCLNSSAIYDGGKVDKIAELKRNCPLFKNHISNLSLTKLAAEHFFQWLSLDDANQAQPGHTKITCLSAEEFRDTWRKWLSDREEKIKLLQSQKVERLALLAAIFLPLSFGAELLGMQFLVRELGLILYDYLGLIVSAGLFLFAMYQVVPSIFGAGLSD